MNPTMKLPDEEKGATMRVAANRLCDEEKRVKGMVQTCLPGGEVCRRNWLVFLNPERV
jgi:hypothetical protein